MLCSACLAIDIDNLFYEPNFHLLHEQFSDLIQSSGDGCELCKAIYETTLKEYGGNHNSAKLRLLKGSSVSLRAREFGKYRLGIEHMGASELYQRFVQGADGFPADSSAAAGTPTPSQRLISGRPISKSFDSSGCFSIMRDWLFQCLEEHSLCSCEIEGFSTGKFFPSRVIDVGPLDGSCEPRLVNREEIYNDSGQCNSSYATLSHRWGPSMPLRTMSDTLSARLKMIKMDELPPTFQDAVVVTRNLGIRYLWIDSLCIIQNSPQDWAQEAAQMASIYLHSKFTIATDASKDCHDGIFKSRPLDFPPVTMNSYSKKGKIFLSWFVRQRLDDWETCLRRPRADTLNQKGSTLHSRVWILQEDMLSRRTIHFGDQQCFWECRTASIAEGNLTPLQLSLGVLDISLDDVSWRWATNKRFLLSSDVEPKIQDQPSMLSKVTISYLKWYTVLVDYSSRDITYQSDIFPALSGLASAFQPLLLDNYLAGLWKNDLHRGLLWIVDDPDYATYAEPPRAPSWSWASVCGGLSDLMTKNRYPLGHYRAEILASETTLLRVDGVQQLDPFGKVSGGLLRLCGRWKSTNQWLKVEKTPWKQTLLSIEDQEGFMLCHFDNGKSDQLFRTEEKDRMLSLLQIAKWGETVDSSGEMCALILESTKKKVDEFRRIGVARLFQLEDSWLESWEIKTMTIT